VESVEVLYMCFKKMKTDVQTGDNVKGDLRNSSVIGKSTKYMRHKTKKILAQIVIGLFAS